MALLLPMIFVSGVVAATVVQRDITTTVTIITPPGPTYDLAIYEADQQTPLDHIDWGTAYAGQSQDLTHDAWIENTGSAALQVVFNVTAPTGMQCAGQYKQGNHYRAWTHPVQLAPGESLQVRWTLTTGTAAEGTYDFDIAVLGLGA